MLISDLPQSMLIVIALSLRYTTLSRPTQIVKPSSETTVPLLYQRVLNMMSIAWIVLLRCRNFWIVGNTEVILFNQLRYSGIYEMGPSVLSAQFS